MPRTAEQRARRGRPGRLELVVMFAALMAMSALAIDVMIPALPMIGRDLGLAGTNDAQLVLVAFLLGFGAGQIVYGPLADRFGRRPVMLGAVALYALFGLASAAAGDFPLLVADRALQGVASAAARVLVTARVRDLFEGAAMARTMSLLLMVFLIVPAIAPTIGQLVLLVADWRQLFSILALYGLALLAWAALRMPETLDPANRRGLDWRAVGSAMRATLNERQSLGYTLGVTVMFGGFLSYLVSVQQVAAALGRPDDVGRLFAIVAATMALGAFTNSRLVGRLGVRRMAHGALLGFALIAALHLAVDRTAGSSLASYAPLIAAQMLCYALASANFATLAMARMGPIAGTAASVQGMVMIVGASLIALANGRMFDGTVRPLLTGIALCAAAALLIVLATERGRLFAGAR